MKTEKQAFCPVKSRLKLFIITPNHCDNITWYSLLSKDKKPNLLQEAQKMIDRAKRNPKIRAIMQIAIIYDNHTKQEILRCNF